MTHLARKAAILMLRLVSGVTISVFEKSMDPSPGWGIGYPTPTPATGGGAGRRAEAPAADPEGGLGAPAGGRTGKDHVWSVNKAIQLSQLFHISRCP